ncbi:MAG TPA: DUF998 domain-containing protein [Ktedonobacterales bacterium]
MNQRSLTIVLLACGAIGPLLFIVTFLVEGATRLGYSAWRHAVSQLSLGDLGWINSVGIIVCGLCILCFAIGLRRALGSGTGSVWGPLLAAVAGGCFVLLGIFPINPALGYPPGVPPSYSIHGLIHASAGTLFFGCISALCFVLGQRFAGDPAWRGRVLLSRITGLVVAGFYIAASLVTTLDMNGVLPDAPGGLLQRIAIISGFGWMALLVLWLVRGKQQALASHVENVATYEP